MENNREFVSRLKSLRAENQLTQKQLAEHLGVSLSSIISYENGQRFPVSGVLMLMQNFFNVSCAYLRGETNDPSPKKWDDDERIDSVNSELGVLLHSLLDDAQAASDKDREQLFAFIPEIRHIIRLEDQSACDLGLSQLREASLSASRAADALQAALDGSKQINQDR